MLKFPEVINQNSRKAYLILHTCFRIKDSFTHRQIRVKDAVQNKPGNN
jgi:hypothetical protein